MRYPGHPPATARQHGFTMVELLVVLVLTGLLMMMGAGFVMSTYKKMDLESSSSQVQEFLQSVYGLTAKNRGPVFLRLENVSSMEVGRLRVTSDSAGATLLRELKLPKTAVLTIVKWPLDASDSTYKLECDPMGRTMSFSTVTGWTMVKETQVLTLTHADMKSGAIKPVITYELSIHPLWNVQVKKITS